VAIAGVIYLFIRRWTGLTIANLYPDSAGAFFGALVSVNVLLAIFNLIPAFPMDGGRIFRGLLALRMSYVRATNLAVAVGQALSVLFIFYGLFFNWWLALIGVFLYIGAGGERQHTLIRSVLREIPASRAMVTDFYRLAPGELLSRALEHVYHGYQDDFPVVNGDGIQGVLTRSNILSAIHERGVDVPVEEIMDREFVSIGGEQSMDEVYRELVSKRKTAAVVLENGRLKG
jgi:hypothetical protein